MGDAYDDSNVFAKILRGEIPSHKVFENGALLGAADAGGLFRSN